MHTTIRGLPRPARLAAWSAILALVTVAAACTSAPPTPGPTPTASPAPAASLAPSPAPTMGGPIWAQEAAARWTPGSPQWNALAHPDEPYKLGGQAHNNPDGVTFTATLARRWWDIWFAHPVDLRTVPVGLQPGDVVLSPAELKQARSLAATTLPPAPANYNPLGLPVIP